MCINFNILQPKTKQETCRHCGHLYGCFFYLIKTCEETDVFNLNWHFWSQEAKERSLPPVYRPLITLICCTRTHQHDVPTCWTHTCCLSRVENCDHVQTTHSSSCFVFRSWLTISLIRSTEHVFIYKAALWKLPNLCKLIFYRVHRLRSQDECLRSVSGEDVKESPHDFSSSHKMNWWNWFLRINPLTSTADFYNFLYSQR